jgi:hypothetical protein
MRRQRIRRLVVLYLCLVSVGVGCMPNASNAPPPAPAGWPAKLDSFTMAWTAEPGIDLTTQGAAIAVRAYVESYFLAMVTEDDKYLYPGFADAVEPEQPGGTSGTHDLHPELGKSDPDVYVGTVRHHVLGTTRSGHDVVLTACAYTYGAAIERPNGGYNALVGEGFAPGPGVYPMRIGLRGPDDAQSNLPPQQGPSRAPFDDVFGGWKVTSLQGGFIASTSRWPEYDSDVATCTQKADVALANQHISPTNAYPLSDFPMLPATPGWPDKPAS